MSSGGAPLLVPRRGGAQPDDMAFIRDGRVGRLATADARGTPSVVPVVYASFTLDEEPVIAIAIDEKPKGDPLALRRVRNILERPEIALVVDEYRENWDELAWVLVRGSASLIEPGAPGHAEALVALRLKYPQYAAMRLEERPAIIIRDLSTRSWRAAGPDDAQPLPRPGTRSTGRAGARTAISPRVSVPARTAGDRRRGNRRGWLGAVASWATAVAVRRGRIPGAPRRARRCHG